MWAFLALEIIMNTGMANYITWFQSIYFWSGLLRTSTSSPSWISKFLVSVPRLLVSTPKVCSLTKNVMDKNKDVADDSKDGNGGFQDPGRRGHRRPEEPWLQYKIYVNLYSITPVVSDRSQFGPKFGMWNNIKMINIIRFMNRILSNFGYFHQITRQVIDKEPY